MLKVARTQSAPVRNPDARWVKYRTPHGHPKKVSTTRLASIGVRHSNY